jgi:uncharacterized protein YcbK (DUF882 family)
MKLRRREFLQMGAAIAWFGAGAHVRAAAPAGRLRLRNLHTDEVLDIAYRRDGECLPDALSQIAQLLRDYRTGEVHDIDTTLLDDLCDLAAALGVDPDYAVISGYRSAQTNDMLRSQSGGVALRSLHMEGRAIDVRLAGIDCSALGARALELGRGGVGYYRRSDFVHLDTGNVRSWRG